MHLMSARMSATAARITILSACALFCGSAGALTLSNRYRSPRNPERKIRTSTRLIVLHTTEAGARSSLNKLCERGECHYCIAENGTAYRIIDREREAFHAGRSMWNGKEDCDKFSVGIEVVGHHDKPITLQQADAIKELVANLKQIYRLGDGAVVCHSHVAYGAPNKWQKRNHRGRKRCGMLFAMASVRVKLGLKAKPAYDPDVKAGRLVQADQYLSRVLYGNVDTMVGRIGAPVEKKGFFFGLFDRKSVAPEKPASPPKPAVASKPAPPPKPAPAPKPVVSVAPPKPPPHPEIKAVKPVVQEHPVVKAAPAKVPRTLADLQAMPGYTQATLAAKKSAFSIAGRKWNAQTTWYYTRGKVVRGDKADARRLEPGAKIFYIK